jgi:hypothetical protein
MLSVMIARRTASSDSPSPRAKAAAEVHSAPAATTAMIAVRLQQPPKDEEVTCRCSMGSQGIVAGIVALAARRLLHSLLTVACFLNPLKRRPQLIN